MTENAAYVVRRASAVTVCRNCSTVICRTLGGRDWWHNESGESACPGAPTATPVISAMRVGEWRWTPTNKAREELPDV